MPATITTSTQNLWASYSGDTSSGRFECPITIIDRGQEVQVTHIYRGFGKTRLENIKGNPIHGKKGFQGEDVTPNTETFLLLD